MDPQGAKIQAIIAAGGSGTRLGSAQPKPLVHLNGRPMLLYVLEVFEKAPSVDSVIVVVSANIITEVGDLTRKAGINKCRAVIQGGETRRESVWNGLQALDEDTEYVLIHDAARPVLEVETVETMARAVFNMKAVILGVPVKPTIKRVDIEDMSVIATMDRSRLWEVQTPQAFQKDLILRAHHEGGQGEATDDAFLVEQMGEKVTVMEGSYSNIKVTTDEDIPLAEYFLQKMQKVKG